MFLLLVVDAQLRGSVNGLINRRFFEASDKLSPQAKQKRKKRLNLLVDITEKWKCGWLSSWLYFGLKIMFLGLRAFSLQHSAQFPLGTLAVLGSGNSFKENKRRIPSSTGPNSAILSHILTPEPTSISVGNVILL